MNHETEKSREYLYALMEDERQDPDRRPSISRVARKFGVNRSAVFRTVAIYVDEGILDRTYRLTEKGRDWLEERARSRERLRTWLVHNQIDEKTAKVNADSILRHCTDEVVALLGNGGIMCKACDRYADANAHVWFGLKGERFKDKLGLWIPDGKYPLHFSFFKVQKKNLLEVSMANMGFCYPAELALNGGVGTVLLKRKEMCQQSSFGQWYTGAVKTVRYQQYDEWKEAELAGDTVSIPLSAFWITYMGEDYRRIRGIVPIRMTCTAGTQAMPESAALLEIRLWKGKS